MTSRNPALPPSAVPAPAAVAALVERVRAELPASFAREKPIHVARAPGRLDVMGGLAASDGGGAMLCHATLGDDCCAAVAIQPRVDRSVQVFSFDLFDEHKPCTLVIPLDALALPLDALKREFAEPGRAWAAGVVGALSILHDEHHIDLRDPSLRGFNVAIQNQIPQGAGLAAHAAIEVASMTAFVDAQSLRDGLDAMALARLCRRVDCELVGGSRGIDAFAAPAAGEGGDLTRLLTQPPFALQPSLRLPEGVRVNAIDSGVRPSDADRLTRKRARAAAMIGHKLILEKMRQLGSAAGRALIADPMYGFLANLALADYKRFFRPFLPESLKGGQFLLQHRATLDKQTQIEPDVNYPVQQATDHFVFDANRIREFIRYIEEAGERSIRSPERTLLLDKAGHLLYASHMAYFKDAQLASDDCDVLIELIRQRERAGFYGARMTAGGSGGVVAVLCDAGEVVDAALDEILAQYAGKTGKVPRKFTGSVASAWTAGTSIV